MSSGHALVREVGLPGLCRKVGHNVAYCARFASRMESVPRRSMEAELRKLLPLVRPGTVLDIGAGDAPYRRLVAAKRYFLLDVAPSGGVDIVSDVHNLACGDSTVDTALATEVLEH